MENPPAKFPELFVRWNQAGWPVLAPKPQPLPAEAVRTAEQVAARQEWEAEGGAIKPPVVPLPKLPL